MPSRAQPFFRFSTSPGPPPQVSTASPPQNRKRPSTRNAWRPYEGWKRTPLPRIHTRVSRLFSTRASTRSGWQRKRVTRAMSS